MLDWTHLRKELNAWGSDMVNQAGTTYNLVKVFNIERWSDYYFPFYSVFVDSEQNKVYPSEDAYPNMINTGFGIDPVDESNIDIWIYSGFECESGNEDESNYDDAAEQCINEIVLKYRGYQPPVYEDVNYYTLFEPLNILGATRMITNDNLTKGGIAIKCQIKSTRHFKDLM
jgi:hypothetical protein